MPPELDGLTDRALIERTLAGDQAAVDALLTRVYPCIRRAASRVLAGRAPDRAVDVAQETMVRLLANDRRALTTFVGEDLAPYASRIARNLALDVIRQLNRRRELPRPEEAGPQPEFEPPSLDPTPDEIQSVKERRERLLKAINQELGKREQLVVKAVFLCEESTQEVAARLQTSANNVHQLLFRARRKLARALGPDSRLLLD